MPEEKNDFSDETPTIVDRVERDLRSLGGLAAKFGFLLAILCHFLPPHYRVLCDALRQACTP